MKIKTLVVGPIDTNCYIATEDNGTSSFVIDAGEDISGILRTLRCDGLDAKAVLATHGHYDHVTAAKELKDSLRVPFCIHGDDAFMISREAQPLLSAIGHGNFPPIEPDGILAEGSVLNAGTLSLKVIHTPGHSPGGVFTVKKTASYFPETRFFMRTTAGAICPAGLMITWSHP
jgi:glyoxylase-like metal-dependent hydrolase (beta-lactamase superfamily II)